MPRKPKPINTEQQEKDYELWRKSEEYDHIILVRATFAEINNSKPKWENKLSSTSHELSPRFEKDFLTYLFDLFKRFFKIKVGKLVGFEYIRFRTIFFANSDNLDIPEKPVIFKIDGIPVGCKKVYEQNAERMRLNLMNNIIEKIDQCEDQVSSSFQAYRKELIKNATKFVKDFVGHAKAGHKDIYGDPDGKVPKSGCLMIAQKNITNLIEINLSYHLFQFQNKDSPHQIQILSFKDEAIREKYIQCLQEVLRVLHKETSSVDQYFDLQMPHISSEINVTQLFYLLNLDIDKNNIIENLYMNPLKQRFSNVQKELSYLYYKGENWWATPLYRNYNLVNLIQEMIDAFIITDTLMGTPLLRDQLNYFYKMIRPIVIAHPRIKENLILNDKNCMKKVIPKLIIFQTIRYMRKWVDSSMKDYETTQTDMIQKTGGLKSFIQTQKKENINEKSIKEDLVQKFIIEDSQQKIDTVKELEINADLKLILTNFPRAFADIIHADESKETLEIEIKKRFLDKENKYGLFWPLEGFINCETKKVFMEAVNMLKYINKAVQQDYEDNIIKSGLLKDLSDVKDHDEKKKLRSEQNKLFDDLNLEHNNNESVKKIRPPELWNYQQAVLKHEFRSSADPKHSYHDGRFEEIDELIDQLTKKLIDHDKENDQNWTTFVLRTIDSFNGDLGTYRKQTNILKESKQEKKH